MDVKETGKIGYYYTAAGDLNAIRMSFRSEDSGTVLYGRIHDNEITLSPNSKEGIPIRVNSARSRAGKTNYLNLRDLLRGTDQFKDKVVDITENDGTYTLSISGNQKQCSGKRINSEVARRARCRKTHEKPRVDAEYDIDLGSSKHLVIPPAFWDKFMEGVIDPCIVYEERYNPAYIVIRCVEAEQAEDIPMIKQLRPAMKEVNPRGEKMVYKKDVRLNAIYLSRFFMYNNQIEPFETFHVKLTKKNEMIVYRKNAVICEVCGRPVHHHIEKMYKLDCCEDCATAAKTIQTQMKEKSGRRADKLRQIAKETRELHDMLVKIKEEM